MNQTRSLITMLTDFGLADGYVGVMKGVVLSIAPDALIVDITHEVPPQDVAAGAWLLATSYRYFPAGTIFVCIVDPGVGSQRLPVAMHAGNWYFVGPDNGLFGYICAEQTVHAAVALTNPSYRLARVSSTFHGRDIFAPAGAYIARGVPLSSLGSPVEPVNLQPLNVRPAVRQGLHVSASVVHVDHFGNLITNIPLSLVPDFFRCAQAEMTVAEKITVTQRRTFFSGDGQEDDALPFMYGDSSDHLGVAIRNGNAARTLGVAVGAPVQLRLSM